jgi:hypothetical protein
MTYYEEHTGEHRDSMPVSYVCKAVHVRDSEDGRGNQTATFLHEAMRCFTKRKWPASTCRVIASSW